MRYAIRWATTRVLPDPAPARISSGPSVVVTARACSGLSRPTISCGAGLAALLERGRGLLGDDRRARGLRRGRRPGASRSHSGSSRCRGRDLGVAAAVRAGLGLIAEVQQRALALGLVEASSATLRGLASRGGTHPTILGRAPVRTRRDPAQASAAPR